MTWLWGEQGHSRGYSALAMAHTGVSPQLERWRGWGALGPSGPHPGLLQRNKTTHRRLLGTSHLQSQREGVGPFPPASRAMRRAQARLRVRLLLDGGEDPRPIAWSRGSSHSPAVPTEQPLQSGSQWPSPVVVTSGPMAACAHLLPPHWPPGNLVDPGRFSPGPRPTPLPWPRTLPSASYRIYCLFLWVRASCEDSR